MNWWIVSLKTTHKNHFNSRYYSNGMCPCFLRNSVFQMLKENDNVTNVHNQWKLFLCINYKALKNKGYKDSSGKIGKSWFIEGMIICGRFLRKWRKKGSF